jgi:hypothetical protein
VKWKVEYKTTRLHIFREDGIVKWYQSDVEVMQLLYEDLQTMLDVENIEGRSGATHRRLISYIHHQLGMEEQDVSDP